MHSPTILLTYFTYLLTSQAPLGINTMALLLLLLLLSKLPESVQRQAHSDGWIPAVMDAVMGLPSNSSWILGGGGGVAPTTLPCSRLASPRLALLTYIPGFLPCLSFPPRSAAKLRYLSSMLPGQHRTDSIISRPAQSRLLRLPLRPCLIS